MTPEVLDKYADVFLEGIKTKLSGFFVEGREVFLASHESDNLKEIIKGWLVDFYNEANG